jgi:hypothetical protein
MVSMPAIPTLHNAPDRCLCGRHEGAEEGPHTHRRWMTTIHRRRAKTWPQSGLQTRNLTGCGSALASDAPTRPKSEKPRKSREGKRSKCLKRQQQERKEKYRKRQCRANHEQHHQLSKLSATHDMETPMQRREIYSGASHTAPNPTPRKGVTAIMLRIRLRRYRDALGKNNSAIAANPLRPSRFTAGCPKSTRSCHWARGAPAASLSTNGSAAQARSRR